MSHAADERQVLADALAEAGPDAPTLCAGWTAHDLAAHLVAREHRPDSAPGVWLRPLAGWTERVRRTQARRPFDELVRVFRSGPPALGWSRLPGVDAQFNLTEHFVHAEDVRRAGTDWEPRNLSFDMEKALWHQVVGVARARYRHSPVGVVMAVPDGPRRVVHRGPDTATLTGASGELLLFTMGRRAHARVEVDGSQAAVARVTGLDLDV
ncbi:MAG TPA: TIGR03085 family metal-binding protein [Actinomycetales bacterium]|nr:TIGR03085 family metal-binding protein [Actinomycetales bacterium]